jgi:hypothetical protein
MNRPELEANHSPSCNSEWVDLCLYLLHLTSYTICGVVVRYTKAVPWLRRLLSCLLQRRLGFAPWSVCVGFVADKVALGKVFLRVFRFTLSIFFVRCSPSHVSCRGGWTKCPLEAAVQRRILTPLTWTWTETVGTERSVRFTFYILHLFWLVEVKACTGLEILRTAYK